MNINTLLLIQNKYFTNPTLQFEETGLVLNYASIKKNCVEMFLFDHVNLIKVTANFT